MYIRYVFTAIFLSIIFFSCHNGVDKTSSTIVTTKDSSSPPKTGIESRESFFYKQTMDIHNEVMAKMGKLNGYKKKVQQQTDSIQSMLASTEFTRPMAQRISRDLDSLTTIGKKLQAADSVMNAWMEGFNPDPKLKNSNANADYFEDQKKKAEVMKKQFFEALGEAEKKFEQHH